MTTTNADQRTAWNGESGQRWVASADRRDVMLAPIADLLLDAASIQPGEHVLDVGCGCGATTLAAAAATGADGAVVGADLSQPMLDVARDRAQDRRNVELKQADAQTDSLGGPFDVAISRFGTMFFDDPVAAFSNIVRHLSPGGRLCIVTWQPLVANQWLVVPGAALLEYGSVPEQADATGPGMFALSEPDRISSLLGDAGFVEVDVEPRTLSLRHGTTISEAVDHLSDSGPGRAIIETIPPERLHEARAAVAEALRPHHDPEAGVRLDAAVLVSTSQRP